MAELCQARVAGQRGGLRLSAVVHPFKTLAGRRYTLLDALDGSFARASDIRLCGIPGGLSMRLSPIAACVSGRQYVREPGACALQEGRPLDGDCPVIAGLANAARSAQACVILVLFLRSVHFGRRSAL